MQYIELRSKLKDFTVFSNKEIYKIDPSFHRRRLYEWQKKGYIKKIINAYYIFSDLELNEQVLFTIANKIYSPSYISFETALSYYNLIPESVYQITSATTRRTNYCESSSGNFIYHSVKSSLFFGYDLIAYNKYFKLAYPEKALLDYLYINSHLRTSDDFLSLRIDIDTFDERINRENLNKYLAKFNNKSLANRLETLIEVINNA